MRIKKDLFGEITFVEVVFLGMATLYEKIQKRSNALAHINTTSNF
jgi:hypothetical protein